MNMEIAKTRSIPWDKGVEDIVDTLKRPAQPLPVLVLAEHHQLWAHNQHLSPYQS